MNSVRMAPEVSAPSTPVTAPASPRSNRVGKVGSMLAAAALAACGAHDNDKETTQIPECFEKPGNVQIVTGVTNVVPGAGANVSINLKSGPQDCYEMPVYAIADVEAFGPVNNTDGYDPQLGSPDEQPMASKGFLSEPHALYNTGWDTMFIKNDNPNDVLLNYRVCILGELGQSIEDAIVCTPSVTLVQE